MCYVPGLKVKVRLLCLIQDPETTSANLQNSRWTNPRVRQHFCQTPIYLYLVADWTYGRGRSVDSLGAADNGASLNFIADA